MRFVPCEYQVPADREIRIFAALLHRTLGDFIDQLLVVISIKHQFRRAHLGVYFRPDRPYKQEILRLAPQIDRLWPTENYFPLDLFDSAGDRPLLGPDEWYEEGGAQPDILLLPSMCDRSVLAGFQNRAYLEIPDLQYWDDTLRTSLSDGWFCAMHYREASYGLRGTAGKRRNVPTEYVDQAIDAVIARGGQVVRIGHEGMTPLAERPGYVDMAAASFMQQAHIVSRSRFFLELSPSGPASLANGFGIPRLRCNSLNLLGPTDGGSIVMPLRVHNEVGADITEQLIRQGLFSDAFFKENEDLVCSHSPLDQVKLCLDALIATTAGIDGWRPVSERDWSTGGDSSIRLPLELALPFRIAI